MSTNEKLEMYLSNGLPRKETDTFREHLHKDSDLRKELKVRRDIEDALKETDFNMFQDTIEQIVRSEEVINTPSGFSRLRTSSFRWLAAAASVAVLIIGANVAFLFNEQSYEPQELYSMYYKPYDSYVSVRSGNIDTDDIFIQALMKYEKQEFDETIALLNRIIEVDNMNIASMFYLGVSFIETGRYADAYNSFTKIVDHNDNLFIEQAEWYLGLTFLRSNEQEKARKQFETIAESQSFYNEKAKELLQQF
jgi:tetratricopeptide (TPR) repeat protein